MPLLKCVSGGLGLCFPLVIQLSANTCYTLHL